MNKTFYFKCVFYILLKAPMKIGNYLERRWHLEEKGGDNKVPGDINMTKLLYI